jgi:hypothetical protein
MSEINKRRIGVCTQKKAKEHKLHCDSSIGGERTTYQVKKRTFVDDEMKSNMSCHPTISHSLPPREKSMVSISLLAHCSGASCAEGGEDSGLPVLSFTQIRHFPEGVPWVPK